MHNILQASGLDEAELKRKKADLTMHMTTMDFMTENGEKSLARFKSILGE
jgi:hypothetical protein